MMTSGNSAVLTRSEIWSTQLKEVLQDDLNAQGWVNWLSEFPDGDAAFLSRWVSLPSQSLST